MNSHTHKIFAALKSNENENNSDFFTEDDMTAMPIYIQEENIQLDTIIGTLDDLSQNGIPSDRNMDNEVLPENGDNNSNIIHFAFDLESEPVLSTEEAIQVPIDFDLESKPDPPMAETFHRLKNDAFTRREFDLQTGTPNCNGFLKLVDYDTTSSDSDEQIDIRNLNSDLLEKQAKNKILIGKGAKFNSENSFHCDTDFSLSQPDSDLESDQNSEVCDEPLSIVGKKGMRRIRKPNKKYIKKKEHNLGKGRSVKETPCKRKCQHKCSAKISEITRHDIHDFYWGLGTYEKQRNWLLSCVKKVDILRRKTKADYSRRHNSFKYYINWNDQVFEVCQQFLLKTLDISQTVIRYATSHAFQNICKTDQRGKHVPSNKTSPEMTKRVHNYIMELPAVFSHYCRKKSFDKKYLPQDLRNISFLYRLFIKHEDSCGINKNNCVSLKVFRNIFKKDFNLGFHLPKKDKCSICEKRKDQDFQENDNSRVVYHNHIKEKEESKNLFLEDQKKVINSSDTVCSSFDLQKVLNTPHGDNMLLYYSRKYAFYNESVYEAPSRNGYCFLWGESDGSRGCNEICTVVYNYLKILDDKGIRDVMLYCDSCAGQNRNRAMLVMLQTFVQSSKSIQTIKIVFLVPGHTYMPVDSIHATIERFIKNRIIWAPSEWNTIITNSRVHPQPFTVFPMEHSDFRNWKKLGESITLKTGLKISKVKQGYFQKESPIFKIKYNYGNSDKYDVCIKLNNQIVGRRRQKNIISIPEKIYKQTLPISVPKKKDLEKLCQNNVIPVRFHNEYLKLKAKNSIKDTLAETDNEDEDFNECNEVVDEVKMS